MVLRPAMNTGRLQTSYSSAALIPPCGLRRAHCLRRPGTSQDETHRYLRTSAASPTLLLLGCKLLVCRAGDGDVSRSGMSDEEAALIEVNDLLFQATELAQQQTLQELLELQQATEDDVDHSTQGVSGEESDASQPRSSTASQLLPAVLGHGSELQFPGAVKALQRALLARGFPCNNESGRFGRETESALKAFQASEGLRETGILDVPTMEVITQYDEDGIFKGTAARIERLRFFWREEGLSDEAAINQLIEKVSAADGSLADTDVLFAKLQRLRRLLPEVDVVKLAVKEPKVLDVDIGAATDNLIELVQAIPGQDIPYAIMDFPAVLAMPSADLKRRLSICLERLHVWSHRSIVPRVLADNLWMLHRVPDYYSNATFNELPVDIQNTMTIGGGGGGFAFKSWGGFTDNNTD